MDYELHTPPSEIGKDQHGLVTHRQLRSCGWSRTMVHDAAQRGALHPTPFKAVFAIGVPPTTAHQRAMAAVLATGGLLSHHWCRWLFGVGRLPHHPPDVIAPASRHQRDGLTLHRARVMPASDANYGIPCTRPERMVIDCAPTLAPTDLRRLVNDVQIRRLATFQSLKAAVEATQGRDTRALRDLLAIEQRGATRSLLEDLLTELSRDRGLPMPTNNATVDGYEVDFAYHDGAIVLEADGYAFHGTKIAFEDDREKWLALEARGRRVLPVSYRQVTELRDRTADDLEAIISRPPAPTSTNDSPNSAIRPGEAPVYGSVSAASG